MNHNLLLSYAFIIGNTHIFNTETCPGCLLDYLLWYLSKLDKYFIPPRSVEIWYEGDF